MSTTQCLQSSLIGVQLSLSATTTLVLKVSNLCFMDLNLSISLNLLRGSTKSAGLDSASDAGATTPDVGAAGVGHLHLLQDGLTHGEAEEYDDTLRLLQGGDADTECGESNADDEERDLLRDSPDGRDDGDPSDDGGPDGDGSGAAIHRVISA
ncbi:hypothetical protein Tco_1536336 [Tanacetum coccineum]